jgi:acyl dehydratase
MAESRLRGVAAGDQLGNLEYLINDSLALEYGRLVGDPASYANLLADDCESMATARFDGLKLDVIWRRFEFLRPPVPGRRIQVGGWLKDIREAQGRPWLRVSAFGVDEIGTEILRSEAVFAVGLALPRTGPVPSISPQRPGHSADFDFDGLVGDSFSVGNWVAPARDHFDAYRKLRYDLSGTSTQSDRNAATQLLAGWLEGQIGRVLGDDFRWGGRLSLACRASIAPGDTISGHAVVIEQDRDHNGTLAVKLILSTWNQRNEAVAAGEVSANIPSPRLL